MDENDLPVAVIDTSFFVSALFSDFCSDENGNAREFIQSIVCNNGQLFVPALFWFEIGNVLLMATKAKKDGRPARLTQEEVTIIINQLSELPIVTDSLPDFETRIRIMEFANKYELTYFDASYLELSQRLKLPLKTLDKQLLEAR